MIDQNNLVALAVSGDKTALEELIVSVRDRIYGIALRMLWHPQEAEDATQEILIRILTNLSSFRQESRFSTWACRIAANYLINVRRKQQIEQMTFDGFARDLDQDVNVEPDRWAEAEIELLSKELLIGCSQAILQCLDRNHRIAYVLGEIFSFDSTEGALVTQTSAQVFRKRLSRARQKLEAFMQRRCGVVNPENRCRCRNRLTYAVESGRVDPEKLLFVTHPARERAEGEMIISDLKDLGNAVTLYRSHPEYHAPQKFTTMVRELISSGRYPVFHQGGEPV